MRLPMPAHPSLHPFTCAYLGMPCFPTLGGIEALPPSARTLSNSTLHFLGIYLMAPCVFLCCSHSRHSPTYASACCRPRALAYPRFPARARSPPPAVCTRPAAYTHLCLPVRIRIRLARLASDLSPSASLAFRIEKCA